MGTITISVPDELYETIKELKMDWSEVATKVILDKAQELKKLKMFSSKVRVSDKAAKEFTDKISSAVAKKYREGK